MRIALVSTGLGRVVRGFEAFTESLFVNLRKRHPEIDVTLFQGGGQGGPRRVVVPNAHRSDIPARWLDSLSAVLLEQRTFALAIYPRLRAGGYDIVHYNEVSMGSTLYHLRRLFGGRYKLLYCNGAPSPPVHYHHRCDFAQVLTEFQCAEALAFGIERAHLFPVPYGLDSELFHPQRKEVRSAVRRQIGVPPNARMILSVAAIKREHKRVDHLLREAAALPQDVWVVVAGARTTETLELERLAESILPKRWRFATWPHARMAELYGAADVFVLCSLTEAFGLVTVEAMLSELPVIIHSGSVFRWLARETAAKTIDMAREGELTQSLRQVMAEDALHSTRPELKKTRELAVQRFAWETLLPRYLEMYRAVVQ